MANAIDNASMVVMALSPNYQLSANCRLEAEYAIQQSKPLVPLMMVPQWRPKGWLGLCLGQKLWIGMYDQAHMTRGCDEVLKRVSEGGISTTAGGGSGSAVAVVSKTGTVARMTSDAVQEWMQGIAASAPSESDAFAKVRAMNLSGPALMFLHNMYSKQPASAVMWFSEQLGRPQPPPSIAFFAHFFGELDRLMMG